MVRKFECKTCKKQFEADDQGSVACPYCHSDNVELASLHLPSWVKYFGMVVTICILCFTIWYLYDNHMNTEMMAEKEVKTENRYVDLDEPLTVEATEPQFDGEKYLINITAINIPKNIKYYFVRMNHFGDKKVLQTSKDGHFPDIPYCEEDGNCYDFAIMDANTDTLLCIPVPVTGFIRQASVSNRMTEQELQALIDNRDPSLNGAGENDYLAPDYTLKFNGLPSDAVNIPTILAEVMEKLDMEVWQQVSIIALDYDEMNRIKAITLKVETTDF